MTSGPGGSPPKSPQQAVAQQPPQVSASFRGTQQAIDWLLSKGWEPLGPPEWPQTKWRNPAKPRKEKTKRRPIMSTRIVTGEDGKPKEVPYHVQVKDRNGAMVEAYKTEITCPGRPVSMTEAIEWELDEESAAAEAAEKAAVKAQLAGA